MPAYPQVILDPDGETVLQGVNLNGDAVPSGGKPDYALLWTEESLI
jgi:hypothetical protein